MEIKIREWEDLTDSFGIYLPPEIFFDLGDCFSELGSVWTFFEMIRETLI